MFGLFDGCDQEVDWGINFTEGNETHSLNAGAMAIMGEAFVGFNSIWS